LRQADGACRIWDARGVPCSALHAIGREPQQGLAEQQLRGQSRAAATSQLGQRRAHFALSKAEPAQSRENSRVHFEPVRIGDVAIVPAISVAKADAGGSVLRDDELSVMHRTVVSATQREEVVSAVLPPSRTRHDVMQIEKARVLAAWNPAAVLVALQNGPARGGRYRLLGARPEPRPTWAVCPVTSFAAGDARSAAIGSDAAGSASSCASQRAISTIDELTGTTCPSPC
jgi:hypothetical protein